MNKVIVEGGNNEMRADYLIYLTKQISLHCLVKPRACVCFLDFACKAIPQHVSHIENTLSPSGY